jgi:cell wall-associated NlpC family hydrolase
MLRVKPAPTVPVLGVALLVAACASTRSVPRPYPTRPAPPGGAAVGTTAAAGATAAAVARSLLGIPYRGGGAGPEGFDCSGLVQYVYAQAGVPLPRSVREQAELGVTVPEGGIEPGDLLFFAIDGREVSHVAIAVGADSFVHAPSSGGVVREERLPTAYWRQRFSGARRVAVR